MVFLNNLFLQVSRGRHLNKIKKVKFKINLNQTHIYKY